MGDGVLIYFGYPQAHEDDAERAVYAALAVIEAVGRLPAREELSVRLGIATGLAVVGVWPRLRGRRLSAVAAGRCSPPLPHSTIGWRGWLPHGWLSAEGCRPLPESREEIRFPPEITRPIGHNTIPINRLETQTGMRAAGSRGMLLREAAGRISAGISHPL
jgi:hypothetical protein